MWKIKDGCLYDSMKNRISMFIRNDSTPDRSKKFLSIDYKLTGRKDKESLCIALYNMAKPYSESLLRTALWRENADKVGSSVQIWGQNYCSKERKCLKDLTLNEIVANCSVCKEDDKSCIFVFIFPL